MAWLTSRDALLGKMANALKLTCALLREMRQGMKPVSLADHALDKYEQWRRDNT